MLYTLVLGDGQRDAHIGMNGAGAVTNCTLAGLNSTENGTREEVLAAFSAG